MPDYNDVVLLATSLDSLTADMLVDLLSYAGIPAEKRTRGAGNVFDSGRIMGADLYVGSNRLEQARAILVDFFSAADEDANPLELPGSFDD